MNEFNPNWYLLWVGLAYPIVIVLLMVLSGGTLLVDPILLLVLPGLTIAGVVLVRLCGNVRFHWAAVAGLVGWIGVITWLFLDFFAMFNASV
jgi:hypothetical protein